MFLACSVAISPNETAAGCDGQSATGRSSARAAERERGEAPKNKMAAPICKQISRGADRPMKILAAHNNERKECRYSKSLYLVTLAQLIRPEIEQSRPLAAAGRTAPSVDGALASSAFSRCVRRKTRAAHDKTTNMCARLAVSNDIVTSACAFPLETQ